MNIDLLNKIRANTISIPLNSKPYSDEFVGIYADGTGSLTYEQAAPAIHSFRLYSEYAYKILMFVSFTNDREPIERLLKDYPYIEVIEIAPLTSSFLYNEWFFNSVFRFVPEKYAHIITLQDDSGFLKCGWENFVTDCSYVGSPWHSDIVVSTKLGDSSVLRVGNGGISYRHRPDIIKCLDFVNSHGGQHRFFKKIWIDKVLMQNNSWLAEDSMFCAVGFTYGFFKPISFETARLFGHEPIEYSTYLGSDDQKPFCWHKIDQ